MNIVLDCIRKPQNLGAIMRIAIATGSDLYLTGNCITPDNKKVKSQVSKWWRKREPIEDYLKVNYFKDLISLVETHGEENYFIGTSPKARIPYYNFSKMFVPNMFVVFGPEEGGLSKEKLDLMYHNIKIPMFCDKIIDSLNLATSVAIVTYENVSMMDRQRIALSKLKYL